MSLLIAATLFDFERGSDATRATARAKSSESQAFVVQLEVQRPAAVAVSALFPSLGTTRTLLPKLDVEGSSPFARFSIVG